MRGSVFLLPNPPEILGAMLLAYIDEIGETGAFVSHDHPKFNTSPAFGYAGFVIPAVNARRFGAAFTAVCTLRSRHAHFQQAFFRTCLLIVLK